MNAHDHSRMYRVYLDGVDVTDRCVEADDEQDQAILIEIDDQGHPRIDRVARDVVKGTYRGRVMIEPVQ